MPRPPSADPKPHQARSPSTLAKKGLFTVVAHHKGRWRIVAALGDRAGAVEKMRSTPSARLYAPDRRAVELTAAELSAPVFGVPPPTGAQIRVAERIEAPAPPRLTEFITARMTPAMRAQIREAARDGARWPGGFKVDDADVVRDALRKYFEG